MLMARQDAGTIPFAALVSENSVIASTPRLA